MTDFTLLETLKPFMCKRCRLAFTSFDSYVLHRRNHHKWYLRHVRKKHKEFQQTKYSVKSTFKKDTFWTKNSVSKSPLKSQKRKTRLRHQHCSLGKVNQTKLSNPSKCNVQNTENLSPRLRRRKDVIEKAKQPENTRRLRAKVNKVYKEFLNINGDNTKKVTAQFESVTEITAQFEPLAVPVKKKNTRDKVTKHNLNETNDTRKKMMSNCKRRNMSKVNGKKRKSSSTVNRLKQRRMDNDQLGQKALTIKDLEFVDVNFDDICKKETKGIEIKGPMRRTSDGRYKCRICEKSYTTKYNTIAHEKNHDKSTRIRCNICLKHFASDKNLEIHMRQHTGLGRLKCEFCHREFNQKIQLTLHTRMHTGDKKYQCEHCHKLFTRKEPWKSHLIAVHQVIPYDDNGKKCKVFTCRYCGKLVANAPTLQIHERSHSGVKPHKCETCGKGFNHKSNLTEHSRIHSDARPYPCEYCGWRFRYRSNLKSHLQVHLDIKNFECQICGNKFILKTALELHLRIHEGKQPFHCPYCQIGSRFKKPMSDHIKLHHSNKKVQLKPSKNLQCPKCYRKFSIESVLTRHMNLHTRKFMCKVCNMAFSCARMLKVHLVSKPHKEIAKNPNSKKLYRCTECKAIFLHKKTFVTHTLIHPNLLRCYNCDVTCSNKEEMTLHKKSSVHKQRSKCGISEVEHMCDSCDETFPSLAKLNAHIHTHMEKFKCDICNINFLSEEALAEHTDKKKHVRAAKLQPQPADEM